MECQTDIMELEEKFEHLLEGLNAIELMVLGMAHAKDPYTGAFNAVWIYLKESADDIQRLLSGAA